MKLYKFECTVWVRGDTAEEALKDLHDEIKYSWGYDNNLDSLQSDGGVFVEDLEDENEFPTDESRSYGSHLNERV